MKADMKFILDSMDSKITEVINTDCMEYLKNTPDNHFDLIITSPPYNLLNKGGDIIIDTYEDKLPEDEYQKQQIAFLNECYRVLSPTGAMFYNHKNRYVKNEIISPFSWILKTNMKVKQEIIWNRLTSVDYESSKFAPIDERIYWLYKDKTFRLKDGASAFTNVWNIKRPTRAESQGHKATYPYQLINRIISSLELRTTPNILDPYAGTGTVGKSCRLVLDRYRLFLIEKDSKWNNVIKSKILSCEGEIEPLPTVKKRYVSKIKKGETIC